ncbi:MAG TPA: hypothetical protein VG758_25580 [Hyphomicrobiaceae bacterium]|jgi:hypothetical protein|nr:hypothetical protein [Hyphomicrobiaceae bacterium]
MGCERKVSGARHVVHALTLAAKPGTLYTLEVSIRSEAFVAGMFGLVGMMAEASANENGGNFQIRIVESVPAGH